MRRRLARRRWLVLISVLVVCVLVVTLAIFLAKGRSAGPTPVPSPPSESTTHAESPSAPVSSSPSQTPETPAPPPGPWGLPGRWTPVFQDEFEGSTLDLSKWRPNRSGGAKVDKPFNVEREAAAFAPENVTVEGGQLVFTVKRQGTSASGRSYPLTSGTVSTEGLFDLRDGDYAEARVRVPQGDGLWPAFWAVTPTSWPPEIDGFEFFDTARQSRPRFNYHFRDGRQTGPSVYGERDVDYRNSWHTYGWLRKNGVVTPYVDGKAYPDVAARGVGRRDYFIIVNLSVQAGHQPETGVGPTQMKVDWVRAWRPVGGGS